MAPSTLSSLDSAIDVDDQQSDHEVQDVPRPGRKRPKRGPTAMVTTVEPVASPAAEEEDTGKRDKKKHKKRHRQPQQQDEAEEVVEVSLPKKKNQEKQRKVHGGLAGRSGQGSGSTLQQVKELRSDAMKYHWPLFAYCRHNNKDYNYCSLCCK